jgi:hypothetical protein
MKSERKEHIVVVCVVGMLLFLACSAGKITEVKPTTPWETVACLAKMDPGILVGSCGGMRTSKGALCTLCLNVRGCLDEQTNTYCVLGEKACDDPACGEYQRK